MVKEKRILSYFMSWLIVGFIVCFIGITNVFADEKLPLGYLSDKSNIQVVVPYNGAPLTLEQFGEYYLDDVDELLIFIDNYEFIGGKIYELELYLPNATLTNANIFTVSGVTSDNKTISCDAMEILQENKKYVHYKWRCNKDVNSLTFNIKNSNDENIVSAGIFRWDYTYLLEVTSTTDNSEIIDGLNKVEQSIIDSNKETQDVIKDQFNDCKQSVNLLNIPNSTRVSNGITTTITNNRININGKLTNSYASLTYDFNFNIKAGTYVFSVNKKVPINIDMYIDGVRATTLNSNTLFSTFTVNQDTLITGFAFIGVNGQSYNISDLIFQVEEGSTPTKVIPYGEEDCTNRIDETNDKLNDLNSSLNDSNVDGSLGDAGSFFDNFTTTDHGGLSGIITAPLVAINQMLNTSCNPMTTTFKGKELSLPCGYEFWNKMGPIQDFVNLVLGGLLCYQIIIKLYKLIEKIKNPEDDRLEVMDL